MSPAIQSSVVIVAYLALFAGVAVLFLFVNLLVGKLFRPANPHVEKAEIYECGEPPIGSSFVQFDLRFYVVALLFIIFDVEVAFFFPWATVFGKSIHLSDSKMAVVAQADDGTWGLTPEAKGLYQELGVRDPKIAAVPAGEEVRHSATKSIREGAKQLAWFTVLDIFVFFAVLMVGFAYVWKRGDLDWVRAVSRERSQGPSEAADENEPALSA